MKQTSAINDYVYPVIEKGLSIFFLTRDKQIRSFVGMDFVYLVKQFFHLLNIITDKAAKLKEMIESLFSLAKASSDNGC